MRLTNKDYINILKYYKKKMPKSNKLLKRQAESIMNLKLCRCIKKLDPKNEAKSIGICTKTIFNNKGLTRSQLNLGKFNCTKKKNISFSKTNKKKTNKKKTNKKKTRKGRR